MPPIASHASARWTASPSPGLDLLRRACRARLLAHEVAPADPVGERVSDWRAFSRCVRANRLWWAAKEILASRGTPAWVIEDARAARQKAMLLNARGLATARVVVPMLLAEGLHPLVIKGPLLQQRLFATPFLRASTDLDILVPPEETARTVRFLTARGYRLPPECDTPWWRVFLGEQHLVATDPALCEIDLHDRVQQPGSPGPRDMRAFVDHTVELSLGSIAAPVLSPTSSWLLSCISLVKAVMHREAGGSYAMEIAAAAIAADADAIAAFEAAAIHQGLERTALFAIGAAETVFGLDLPVFAGRPRPAVVPQASLCAVVLGLHADAADAPKRSRMLWTLCDPGTGGRIGAYAGEMAWSVGAELCRRVYHSSDAAAAVLA